MENPPTKIIIDTDLAMGEFAKDVDDGLALIMALNSPEVDVVAISGVYGNTKLKNVSKNVPKLLEMFPEKSEIPEYIEGASSYIDWREKKELPGIVRLREIITENAPITLVPIGPLTNIALLFHFYPELLSNGSIDKLVIMGGALDKWEFNFANDPSATNYVLNLPITSVICGYEVCMAQKFTREHYNQVKEKNTPRSNFIIKEIKSWLKLNEIFGKGNIKGFYPFDCVAISYVIQPDLFIESEEIPVYSTNTHKKRPWKLDFSTKTYRKEKKSAKKETWVTWTKKIDSKSFMKLLMQRLN
jgi:non-specific riboncleoside hydrolase